MENPKSQIPSPNETPNPKSQQGRKPFDLRERTFEFSIRILEVAALIPPQGYGAIVRQQIARSGTSVGANVEEADGGLTRAEKRKSFVVARKEVRETRYWLRIVDRIWAGRIAVAQDVSEATELLYILSAIISKLQ
jgi:four helix bundle protein